MKKIALMFLNGLLILIISSCDYSLKYTQIEIIDFPSKITYFVGRDDKIDLNGGKIKLTTHSKDETVLDMSEKDFDGDDEFNIVHSIDFKKPGVYVVEIKRTENLKCSFAIEVIEIQ